MKKILFLLFTFLSFKGISQSNSVLNNGSWYKFAINKTGIFKIDATFLRQLGINTSGLNPKNIKIYGNGGAMLPEPISNFRHTDLQENAIYVEGENDGVFNENDYILFYGKGPHSWEINTTIPSANHLQNIYSDNAYYFITVGNSPGKRVTEKTQPLTSANLIVTTFDDYAFYEKEERNLFSVGRVWLGEDFSVENSQNFNIPFNNHVPNSNIRVTIEAVASSSLASNMNININGQNFPNINFSPVSGASGSLLATTGNRTNTINLNSNSIDINLTYNNNGLPSARAYLNYIEVLGKKNLNATGSQFLFRSFDAANTTGIINYIIENTNNIHQLWDVTNNINPKRLSNLESSGSNFSFNTNGGVMEEYIVVNNNDTYTPFIDGYTTVANQNLHNLTDIEYLVITSTELQNQAQRLVNYHQTNSNLTGKVVTLPLIYNEFSSGSPDVTAIRDFIKHLYDNSSTSKKLKYVCFFGDSSFDYKNRIQNNNNIVPTFHAIQSFNLVSSYVTDDYFVMIDDNEGSMNINHTIDIASGRIPVTTVEEARTTVDKILKYYDTSSYGDWRNSITLVADDVDKNDDIPIQTGLEEIADTIKKYKPEFNINKLYADAFKQETSSGGERYPQVKEAITNSIEKGTLVLDYFGHGGENGLSSERLLEIPQIEGFNNKNLPLFITVTCEFSRFDNPLRNTAGEKLFLNPNGGAVSMITTTREVFITTGQRFNRDLTKYVFDFDNNNLSIAENLIQTKNITTSSQKYFIYYFGDPAMRLATPKPNIKITKMNDIDVTQSLDTLKALSKISLEGIITDTSDNIIPNFNGTIFTTIFDKPVNKQTLVNDGIGNSMIFDSQESKIFRGKASVQNGTFKFDFIVPKDIKIAYGKAKVSMYAENQQIDKSGANFDITVGGINENAPEDTTGPEIQAFMNDESFVDGANTNTSPNLIIKLSDISGINTSITAVDHDITIVLDNNEQEAIVLNDYYETELNDYTKGKVTYQLRNLSVGPHTLKIKAWDTYNNSSETTLTFVVVSDTGLTLDNVLNYPNPFVNYTEFWFNHNKPNEPLEVQVQIFTVSGKLVKTINQLVQTTGGLSRSITWNGLDDFGNKIGKGVYVYKLRVKSTVSNLTSEKYEKLVIL